MNPIRNINLAGAGNVARHLASELIRNGITIHYLYNRTASKGEKLANEIGAVPVTDLQQLTREADMLILALSDQAYPSFLEKLSFSPIPLVHTSGTISLAMLASRAPHAGVFYPLQTFRKAQPIDFSLVPICIEASDQNTEDQLVELAQRISPLVDILDSEKRKVLHLGAVMAGNFTNFLYVMAQDLLEHYGISFDLLKPLIRQTALNIEHPALFSLQTGPAIREDLETIQKHQEILKDQEDWKSLYQLMTDLIINRKKKDGKL